MHTQDFNPEPLLQVMADSIVQNYGPQGSLRIAERAILRVSRLQNQEALEIWLAVHALLQNAATCPRAGQTLH
jgi:hypothetical protein